MLHNRGGKEMHKNIVAKKKKIKPLESKNRKRLQKNREKNTKKNKHLP